MLENWLGDFKPNVDDLFDVLLPDIDDGVLREIAAADYGQDVEKHLAPLKLFCATRTIPTLDWNPKEVLELIRWSEPDQPDWKPGSAGRRGHLLRAFACSLLLRSYAQPENKDRWNSFNETAMQLADSLRALGGPVPIAGIHFLAWCVENLSQLDPDEIEGPFLGLALLSLAVDAPGSTDRSIIGLCEWIDEKVSALLREKQWWATRQKNWLLSTNHHNLKNERWIEVGRQIYKRAEAEPASEKGTWVARIGRSLAED